MKTEFSSVLEFCRLLNHLRNVERVIRVNGQARMENDVEHSYQLGMLAWYIASSNRLSLDIDKVLRYALVHDIPEVYAGDTYIFSSAEHLGSKKQREADAITRLKGELADFPELLDAIDAYERKEDPESLFVYALDKVYPVINIYLDNGRTWNEQEVTLEMIIENKAPKVALSPEIEHYFNDLVRILEENKSELFTNE